MCSLYGRRHWLGCMTCETEIWCHLPCTKEIRTMKHDVRNGYVGALSVFLEKNVKGNPIWSFYTTWQYRTDFSPPTGQRCENRRTQYGEINRSNSMHQFNHLTKTTHLHNYGLCASDIRDREAFHHGDNCRRTKFGCNNSDNLNHRSLAWEQAQCQSHRLRQTSTCTIESILDPSR